MLLWDIVASFGVDELGSVRVNAIPTAVVCGAKFAEVAGSFRLVGHAEARCYLRFSSSLALIRQEEEYLVLLYRAAQCATKFIALEGRGIRNLGWEEIIAGIKNIVSQEFEAVAVKGVGSRLRNLIDDSAGRPCRIERRNCWSES